MTFTIYSRDNCPACDAAIALCKSKGVGFEVLKLGQDYSKEDLQKSLPSARSLPQIFMGQVPIGGLENLKLCLK